MFWLDCANNLFQNFVNKNTILQRIKNFKTNKNTSKERILRMSFNIESRLTNDLNKNNFFYFVWKYRHKIIPTPFNNIYILQYNNDTVCEELIKLASILAKTTDENICDIVVNFLENINLDLFKIASVTTDDTLNMIRKDRGFIKLFSKKKWIPLNLLSLYYFLLFTRVNAPKRINKVWK